VPASLVEDQDRVGAGGYPCGDLIEVNEGSADPLNR
jgi:hypothetical protein